MDSNINHEHTVGSKPKLPMYMIFLIVTLAVLCIVLGIVLFQNNQSLKQTQEDRKYVVDQKEQLEHKLNDLIVGYDSLKTDNDSINDRLTVEQDKIRRLLKVQASNAQKLKMYEKELGTLRKVMRSYIIQIDSLNTRNRELTEENIAVRQQLQQKETDYQELTQTTTELTETVASAQELIAKNILAEGLNNRSKPKDKIDKIEKIRVCFTVRENKIAKAETKTIYLRIVRPDEVGLSSSEAGLFDYNGESMVYTAKRELEFDNMDIDMCIYWDKTEELIPGTYFIGLYCEGAEIGTTSLDLK